MWESHSVSVWIHLFHGLKVSERCASLSLLGHSKWCWGRQTRAKVMSVPPPAALLAGVSIWNPFRETDGEKYRTYWSC